MELLVGGTGAGLIDVGIGKTLSQRLPARQRPNKTIGIRKYINIDIDIYY